MDDQCSQRSGAAAKSPERDGTIKLGPFSSGKPQDGGPCNVRQISVGDGGTVGDCLVKFFVLFNNFVCQTEAGTYGNMVPEH